MKAKYKFLSVLTILILAVTLFTSGSVYAATLCVEPTGTPGCYTSIQDAVYAASPGDTITIMAGTYSLDSTVNLNKENLTLQGVGNPLIQVSGTGDRLDISATGVTLDGLRIEKTDGLGEQNIIRIRASNTTITDNEIFGHYVFGDGPVTRAMVINAGGFTELNINGNTIHHLRQPAYISGTHTGTIANNFVYYTRGWVLEGGNLTFTNNTWGTGANANVFDIAIIAAMPNSYYTDIVAMSNANNGAFIEDQRTSPATLSIVYVDGSAAAGGTGTATSPVKTITQGVTRVVPGGTIHVAAGIYVENILVNKSVEIVGAGQESTTVIPAVSNPNPCTGSSMCGGAASNIFLVQANNVIIHDLTINGDNPTLTSGFVRDGADLDARNGIIKNTSGTFDDLEVYNTTVQNIYLRGIYSTAGTFNFHDNIVSNVQGDYYSIAMFAWYGPGTMANNTVLNSNDAIAANWSKGIQFINNTVTNSGTGIHTDNAGSAATIADLIEGNTIADCKADGYGIFVFVPYIAPTVSNNTITNCAVGLSAWGQARQVTTQFLNNTVTGPTAKTGSVGAYITTDQIGYGYNDVSVNFTGNVITGFETGVYLTADAQSWTPNWTSRTITAAFSNNSISGNISGLDKGISGTYNVTATPNWWGSASGPGSVGSGNGDTIAAGVPYTPWLCSGTDTSTDPGFQPTGQTDCSAPVATGVSVSPTPIYLNAVATLTAAIDDSGTGNSNIKSAEYNLNNTGWLPMTATDGAFDGTMENVKASFTAATPGSNRVCVRATDSWGNLGAESCSTFMVGYKFISFSQPIDMNAINIAKAGQTIPVKWRLTDANGLPVSDPASFVQLHVQGGSCPASVSTDAIENYSAGSGLQYLGDGYWQFNWKTLRSSTGCRSMYLEFVGGVNSPTVTFQFK